MPWKGKFKPKNPKKYKGDISNIVYRSKIELFFMRKLDEHPDILEYASEEFFIPYIHPLDNKIHRYFPDFWVKKKTIDGNIEINVVEIKHSSELEPVKQPKRKTKRYLTECIKREVNKSKWDYAREFCKKQGWTFIVLTEKDIGLKY